MERARTSYSRGSSSSCPEAAIEQCVRLTARVHAGVAAIGDDEDRDAAAVAELTDLALRHPGWAQVVLASIPPIDDERLRPGLSRIGDLVSTMFRLGPHSTLRRRARVTASLSVLVTLALTYEEETTAETARPLIVELCLATLGHPAEP